MVNTEALFRIGDAAQDEGNFALARQSFERGAALGDAECLCRLAYMFDIGRGVDTDKAAAMRFYHPKRRLDGSSDESERAVRRRA